MDLLEKVILPLIVLFGFGLTSYILKTYLTRIEKKVDALEVREADCRDELPIRYCMRDWVEAQFTEVKEDIANLFSRTKDLEKDVAYAKGLRNGNLGD